jgi:hypothetical protein
VKPFLSSNTIARASPSTSSAVVVVVGARLNGHASLGTGISTTKSLILASVDSLLPVIAANSQESLDELVRIVKKHIPNFDYEEILR